MELKPKQIEMPNRRTEVNNIHSTREQQTQKDRKNDEPFVKLGDIFGSLWNGVFFAFMGLFLPVGMFFVSSQENNTAEDILALIFESIEKDNLIIPLLIVGLWCVCWCSISIVQFVRAIINLIKYIRQDSSARQKQMAIKKETERLNGTNDNRVKGIIVNGRKLTPEETKNFVKKMKKFVNVFFYFFAFFAVLNIILGNVLGGITTFAVFFFIRKLIFHLLDEEKAETIKQILQELPFSLAKTKNGWEDNGTEDRATPAELKKAIYVLNMFICLCLYFFFSDSNVSILAIALILFFIRRSFVKQIKEDEAKLSIKTDRKG